MSLERARWIEVSIGLSERILCYAKCRGGVCYGKDEIHEITVTRTLFSMSFTKSRSTADRVERSLSELYLHALVSTWLMRC